MEYRSINSGELRRELFSGFTRHQVVVKCRRRQNDAWVITDAPFIDDWDEKDYNFLVDCLKNTLATGGFVVGAFDETGTLKGFASVEGVLIGTRRDFADLSCLHVSEELRGRGVGRALFEKCCEAARALGARKLYISSHSAVETQRFYAAMGCVDTREPNAGHVEREPYDCQLEKLL